MRDQGALPSTVRTIAVIGHRSAGKTSLADRLLSTAGVTRTPGRVDDGTSLLDHSVEARQQRQTLEPSVAWLRWGDQTVFVVDTPGAQDLLLTSEIALHQVDGALLCLAGSDGVPHGAVRLLGAADQLKQPLLAVVHQIDRPCGLDALLSALRESTERRVIVLQLPFFDEAGELAGVIDLLADRALRFDPEGSGAFSPEPIPRRLRATVDAARDQLVESVALDDEALLEEYLEFLELPPDTIRRALAAGVRAGRLLPVLFSSATQGIGASPLLDAVVDLLPSPAETARVDVPRDPSLTATVLHTTIDDEGRPFTLVRVWAGDALKARSWRHGESGASVRVRKLFAVRGPRRSTPSYGGPGAILATWDPVEARPGDTLTEGERYALRRPALPPVMVRRVLAPDPGQDPRLVDQALAVLERMDHALDIEREAHGGAVLGARSLGQLDRALSWLRNRMGTRVQALVPAVDYREVPAHGTWGIEGVHLREAGGLVEEYGRCALDLDPVEQPEALAFCARVDHEDLPERFVGAVCEGALEAAREGPLAGFPVIGARVTCVAGEYDILSSTEDHFRIAGANAMRAALSATGTRLAEPWVDLEVQAPSDATGAVLDLLTGRRGRILDVQVDRVCRIRASCPERETHDLAARLGAVTAGRGWFSARRSHYDLLPDRLVSEALRERLGAVPELRKVGS